MEFVSAIISPIVESLIVPVKKQLGYLFSSTKHVGNMNTRMKQLDCTSCDVKNHMETNHISNLEIPTSVTGWLEEVEKIKEDAQIISSMGNGCFNLKMRYRVGRNAFKITEEMRSLIEENSKIIWCDAQKPLGKVNSQNASTSSLWDGDAQNYFKSREKSFKYGLKFLQQDHTSQVIALCGMGGVGKTTMMEQLKKAAEDKKMFDWIVKVVIGQKINMLSIQQAVAEYMGQPLTETSITARADRLRIRLGKMFEGQKKVLVILDGFLPLAVKLIEISYTYLKEEEEKRIFLLCGLFPDDFYIPIKELTRYAWGLRLLNDVSTVGDGRDMTKTCVQNLKNANLLIDSNYIGCVKLHDLVLAFVLGRVSKGDHPWIINHGDISKWNRAEMRESCKRLPLLAQVCLSFLVTKYPNLSLLRLTHGDKSLRFTEEFYENGNVEVLAYENLQYPLLPRSIEYATKLQTLILHQCVLMFDCSPIGELLNLEILIVASESYPPQSEI